MKNEKLNELTLAALIASLYVILTMIANMFGLGSGVIQVRISEALTILPMFTWAAVPGLCIGCVLANLMTGCALWDIILGSLATLIGALGTYHIGRKIPILGPVFPILANCIIVPFVLQYVYGSPDSYWFMFITVGIGEVISCGLLGGILYKALKKRKVFDHLN